MSRNVGSSSLAQWGPGHVRTGAILTRVILSRYGARAAAAGKSGMVMVMGMIPAGGLEIGDRGWEPDSESGTARACAPAPEL